MSKRLFVLGVVAIAILTTSAFAANRGVAFTPIGFIENPGNFPASIPMSMTADGNTMIVTPTPYGAYCVFWNLETGWGQEIGNSGSTCVISADGSTVMGSGYNADGLAQAGVWTGVTDEWDPIPVPDDFEPCGSSGLSFYDMGGNADYATGLTWTGCTGASAYRWDASTDVTENLGSLTGDSSRGNAISRDGSTIVGWLEQMCGSWRGARWDDGQWSYIDGMGVNEPKACTQSGAFCCADYDCPEVEVGICESNVCTTGPLTGSACSGDWDCPNSNEGICDETTLTCVGGTEPGSACTSKWDCDNTVVCDVNPTWDATNYKGEAADVSADGNYVFGQNFGDSDYNSPDYDPYLWASAYIQDSNGSFTQVMPPPDASPYDSWTAYQISDNGKTAVGTYGWWIYSYPTVWNASMGSIDLQWFLIGQGLDDLWFWYLRTASTVSADGTIIGGDGYNPDYWIEGYHLDMNKVSICHMPGGDVTKARTLTIGLDSVGDHMAHGDPLMTCEFYAGGGNSRAALRGQTATSAHPPVPTYNSPDFNVKMGNPTGPKLKASYVNYHETGRTRPEVKTDTPRTRKERSPRAR